MKKNIVTIVVFFFFIMAVFFVFNHFKSSDVKLDEIKENLKNKNDSLFQVNHKIDLDIKDSQKMLDSFNILVNQRKEDLKLLKEKQDEKIYHIKNSSDIQLFEFFSKFGPDSTAN